MIGGVLLLPVVVMLTEGIPNAHWTRFVGIGVGLAVAVDNWLARRARRTGRSGWMVAGLILAGLSWGFMPPWHGKNLWAAHNQAERLAGNLEVLPPGDQAGFRRCAEERARLMREYPELRNRLREAEKSWQQRSEEAAAPLRARFDDTRRQVRALVRQDRYQGAATLADRFVRENEKQAKEVGLFDEMDNFRESCGYMADLAGRAGRWDDAKR
jgi:hypothetical protein